MFEEEEKDESCEVCEKVMAFDKKLKDLITEELEAQETAEGEVDTLDVLVVAQALAINASDIVDSIVQAGMEEHPSEALQILMQSSILEGLFVKGIEEANKKIPNLKEGAVLSAIANLTAKLLKNTNHERAEGNQKEEESSEPQKEVELTGFLSSLGEEG